MIEWFEIFFAISLQLIKNRFVAPLFICIIIIVIPFALPEETSIAVQQLSGDDIAVDLDVVDL